MVTFYMTSGVETGDTVEDKMLRAHEAEAANYKAEFYNYGWVVGKNAICSKTSGGILSSEIDPATMEVRHSWGTGAS